MEQLCIPYELISLFSAVMFNLIFVVCKLVLMIVNESVSVTYIFIHGLVVFMLFSLLSRKIWIGVVVTNFAHHFAVSSYVCSVAWLSWAWRTVLSAALADTVYMRLSIRRLTPGFGFKFSSSMGKAIDFWFIYQIIALSFTACI